MKARNPLETLGISPEICKELTDAEIMQLCRTNYYSLQKIFHPDKQRAGKASEKIARAISEAWSQLQNQNLLADFKKLHLRPKPYRKKITELQETLEDVLSANNDLTSLLMEYLFSLKESKTPNIWNLLNTELLIADTALAAQFSLPTIARKEGSDQVFFRMKIDGKGGITKIKEFVTGNREETSFSNKHIIGCITNKTIVKHTSIHQIMNLAVATSPHQNKLVAAQNIKIRYHRQKKIITKLLPESFKFVVPLLSPTLEPHSYLFTLNVNAKGVTYFLLEGLIREIHPM